MPPPAAACDFQLGFSPSHFKQGPLNRRAWHCGKREDAKPRAPVCLSASSSWAPQGTRDREGREREGKQKEGANTEEMRKKSQSAGMKPVCSVNKTRKNLSTPWSQLTYMASKQAVLLWKSGFDIEVCIYCKIVSRGLLSMIVLILACFLF